MLNGWQRLWVVISFLSIIYTSSDIYESYRPKHESTQNNNSFGQATEKPIKKPRFPSIRVTPEITDEEKENARKNHNISMIKTKLLFWISFCTGLYASGWAIGWVYRGFRKKA